jgi:hypothetical protein
MWVSLVGYGLHRGDISSVRFIIRVPVTIPAGGEVGSVGFRVGEVAESRRSKDP